MYPTPCPCAQPLGTVTLARAQRLAAIGVVGMAVGALVSQRRYDWAAPGALVGGVAALAVGHVALPKA
jgi:hypothetical protein